MSFKVGDQVTWTSQAAGIERIKIGKVVEVVPPRHEPKKKKKGNGMWRDHESYVVRAHTFIDKYSQGRDKLYWPRANMLKPYKGAG